MRPLDSPAPWASAVALCLIAAIVLVHAAAQPTLLRWDPDTALYILHARAIAHGLPYAETGYVFNPLNAIHPRAYPPGFPLLLAPLATADGVDLPAMKAVVAVSLGLFLLLFHGIARLYLAPALALCLLAVVGLNPFLSTFASYILSELPFMVWTFASLLVVHHLQGAVDIPLWRRLTDAVVAGILVAAAIETRSVGMLLIPAIVATATIRFRRNRPQLVASLVAVGVAGLGVALIGRVFPHDSTTYARYFTDYSLRELLVGIGTYLETIPVDYLDMHGSHAPAPALVRWLAWALTAGVVAFAIAGLIIAARRRPSTIEAFAVLYAGFIIVYPIRFEPARYALPVLPLLLLYAAVGLDQTVRGLPRGPGRAAAAGLLAGLALVYGHAALAPTTERRPPWVLSPSSRALFQAIRDGTPKDALVLADEPTTIALFADHRSSIWPTDARAFWPHAAEIGATHVLLRRAAGPEPGDRLDPHPNDLAIVFENADFTLYRIRHNPPGVTDSQTRAGASGARQCPVGA